MITMIMTNQSIRTIMSTTNMTMQATIMVTATTLTTTQAMRTTTVMTIMIIPATIIATATTITTIRTTIARQAVEA